MQSQTQCALIFGIALAVVAGRLGGSLRMSAHGRKRKPTGRPLPTESRHSSNVVANRRAKGGEAD